MSRKQRLACDLMGCDKEMPFSILGYWNSTDDKTVCLPDGWVEARYSVAGSYLHFCSLVHLRDWALRREVWEARQAESKEL